MKKLRHYLFLLTLLLLSAPISTLWAANFSTLLQQPQIGGVSLQTSKYLKLLYAENGDKPLWQKDSVASLARALQQLEGDGLQLSDYLFPAVGAHLQSPSNQISMEADLLLTEAFLRGLYSLYFGKADPEKIDPNNNFGSALGGGDRVSMFVDWIRQAKIEQAFDWARPNNKRYHWLREALARYRAIEAAGGWPQTPKGKTIKPGDSDPRVAQIRKRLYVTGDLSSAQGSDVYDAGLQKAVKYFQERHYLSGDGVIGPRVLAALNVPVGDRINQIRVNLERQRWLFPEQSGDFLVVDIAGFKIYWIRNHEIIWKEQVQVGKEFTKTPVFKDKITYIDFNPTWTVPPGIMKRSFLPKLRADPGYLEKKGFLLRDRNGKAVDAYSVDWNSAGVSTYRVVQPPGKDNALGLVKFMFPNKHHVFLHDTNHRELFAKDKRTTSSGCIRLNNPFDLAERLLGDQGYGRSRIDEIIAGGKTTRVKLNKPMPILIHYNTAWAKGAEISFKDDIYKRDQALLKALDGPFQVSERVVSNLPERNESSYDNSRPSGFIDF